MGDIPTAADADDHIFGIVLLDDWSGKCVKFGKVYGDANAVSGKPATY